MFGVRGLLRTLLEDAWMSSEVRTLGLMRPAWDRK